MQITPSSSPWQARTRQGFYQERLRRSDFPQRLFHQQEQRSRIRRIRRHLQIAFEQRQTCGVDRPFWKSTEYWVQVVSRQKLNCNRENIEVYRVKYDIFSIPIEFLTTNDLDSGLFLCTCILQILIWHNFFCVIHRYLRLSEIHWLYKMSQCDIKTLFGTDEICDLVKVYDTLKIQTSSHFY